MIIILAKTKLKSIEDRNRLFEALEAATPATLEEPGVITYDHWIDHKDPLLLNAVDIYASEEAIKAHNKSEHIAALISSIAGVEADINLTAYQGDMKPFDIGATMASGEITEAAGASGLSFSLS
jgi:quinol monooxygenase YgiN